MMKNIKNSKIRKIQEITYIIVLGLMACLYILHANEFIHLTPEYSLIMLGAGLSIVGTFGILNHEVSLRNAKPIQYEENSIAGIIANIAIITLGIILLGIGVFA